MSGVSPRPSRRVWWLAGAALAAAALARLVEQADAVSQGVTFIATSLTIDDSYYYLETAWRHATEGVPTFDGLHRTNGVQMLWYLVVLGLASLAPGKDALLSAAMLTCASLNAISFALIWIWARAIGLPVAAVIAGAGWLALTPRYLTGMESSLHACLFWGLLAAAAQLGAALDDGRAVTWRVLTFVFVGCALVWTRVDSFFVLGPVAISVAVALRRADIGAFRRVVPAAAALASGAAVLLGGAYYLMAGTVMPISATIKALNYAWHPEVTASVLTTVLTAPVGGLSPEWTEGRTPMSLALTVLLVALALAVMLVPGWRAERRADARFARAASLLGAAAVGGAIQILYLGGLGDYAIYGFWYLSAILITLVAAAALAGAAIVRRFDRAGMTVPGRVLTAGVCLLLIGGASLEAARAVRGTDQYRPDPLYVRRLEVARLLADRLQPDDRLAAWNAGQLGYFSGRIVINLDGLINSPEYYREFHPRRDRHGDVVIDQPDALRAYLRRLNVRYVVDWEARALRATGLLPIADDRLRESIEALGFHIAQPWP